MKKLAFATALLGAGLVAQTAHADETGFTYYLPGATLENASYTITLSGECSGKITLPVTNFTYGRYYAYTGNAIDRDGSEVSFDINTSDNSIYADGNTDAYAPEDKHSEVVKNGKLTLKNTFKGLYSADSYFYSLAGGGYDSQITCKNGQPLSSNLQGWDAYINSYASSYKAQATLSHVHPIDNPSNADFKFKYTASGILDQKGACTVKGTLFSPEYSVTCAQPKKIGVKIAVIASGVSNWD